MHRQHHRSVLETIAAALAYARGSLTTLRLDRCAIIASHGRTRIVKRNGRIVVGHCSRLWPNVRLVATSPPSMPAAQILIGHHSSVGDNTQVHSNGSVAIGNHALVSWNVNILGHYYHSPGGVDDSPGQILIGDHAWIGCSAIVLKGVRIGRGAIVGAGAVVTAEVAPYTQVVRNPKRFVRNTGLWNGY